MTEVARAFNSAQIVVAQELRHGNNLEAQLISAQKGI